MKKDFYRQLITLALPITIQGLILSSMNMADVFMIGQLGDIAVASLGASNQIVFILTTLLVAISGGASIFSAQYYGSGDHHKIKYVFSISFWISMISCLIFFIGTYFYPEKLASIYSKDPEVISAASKYMKIVSYSFVATGISAVFSVFLRSIGHTKVPMMASSLSLVINIGLNYLLIFGNHSFPKLGIEGAAIATTIARGIECLIIFSFVYMSKSILAFKIKDYFSWNSAIARLFAFTAGAVIINDILWALGQTTYSIIYGRMGTQALAAINMENSIERLAYVGVIGFSSAAAIMVGQKIGEGREDLAYEYGIRFYKLSVALSILLSIIIFIFSKNLVGFYNVDTEVFNLAHKTLIAFCFIFPIKSLNLVKIVGILRAGGDTAFAMRANLGALWIVGIPVATIGAFYLGMPLYWVYLLAAAEELVRLPFGLMRFFSKKWIKNFAVEIA